jgi:hypothetical protein
MPMHDDFDPAHPLPVFLDDQYEQQGIGTVRDRAGTWSRVLKASILIAIAAVIGVAALSGNPVALVADVTASLVDNLGLQPATAPSTPTIQAAVDTQASPPPAQEQAVPLAAQDTPARSEVAAAESAAQDQAEKSEPPPEALFKQFQAWAAEKDAQSDVAPARPVQDRSPPAAQNASSQAAENAPAEAAENARPSLRIMQEPPHVRPVHSARAEMRTQNPRKQVRRPLYARPPVPPAQIARAQDARAEAARAQEQPAPQSPSFLPIFGGRN